MGYVTESELEDLEDAYTKANQELTVAHLDPQKGDIVRTKKYAQPLEVLTVNPAKQEVGTKPLSNPLPNVTETHKFSEVIPYRKEG